MCLFFQLRCLFWPALRTLRGAPPVRFTTRSRAAFDLVCRPNNCRPLVKEIYEGCGSVWGEPRSAAEWKSANFPVSVMTIVFSVQPIISTLASVVRRSKSCSGWLPLFQMVTECKTATLWAYCSLFTVWGPTPCHCGKDHLPTGDDQSITTKEIKSHLAQSGRGWPKTSEFQSFHGLDKGNKSRCLAYSVEIAIRWRFQMSSL